MKYILIFILLLAPVVKPQEIKLQGNLYKDSRIVMGNYKQNTPAKIFYEEKTKKSPLLAGVLSAIIPGAGEVYTGNYWKAAIFFVVDAAAIYTAIDYTNKANAQTNYFQNFADKNWSAVKYAEYLNQYHKEHDNITNDVIPINPDENLPPWKRVNFNTINEFEVGSHKLPSYGEQQYYELIGKYHQFSAGWNDFVFPTAGFSTAPEPSATFLRYSLMRGDANDLFKVKSRAVAIIYINHILSAADAVWSAISFNKDLAINLRMQENPFAYSTELSPVLNLRYNF